MSAADLLARAAALGVEVYLPDPAGDRVTARPADRLPAELLDELRRHKAEIREHLRRQHRAEDSRALPSDPAPEARVCAWCGRDLEDGRQRLCRRCTDPDVTPVASAAKPTVRSRKPWAPPGRIEAPRQCIRCSGGLAPGDADGGPCSSCEHYFKYIEPRRIQ